MKNIFKDRRFKHGSLATVMTVGLVAVVVLVNVIFSMLAARFPMDVDLTSNKIFEVSDQTIDYLKGLDKDVSITVLAKEEDFSGNNTYYNQANEVIHKYAKYSSHITIEYKDLYSNPDFVQKYPKDTLYQGYIIVACGLLQSGAGSDQRGDERHQRQSPHCRGPHQLWRDRHLRLYRHPENQRLYH